MFFGNAHWGPSPAIVAPNAWHPTCSTRLVTKGRETMGLTSYLLLSTLEFAAPQPEASHYLNTEANYSEDDDDHYSDDDDDHDDEPEPPGPFSATAFLGLGIGAGTPGGPALVFYTGIDLWPWRYLGTGIEGAIASATTINFLGPDAQNTQLAARLRLSGRLMFRGDRLWLTATIAGGLSEFTGGSTGTCSWSDQSTTCLTHGPGTIYQSYQSNGVGLSYAGELAVYRHWESLRFGLALRGEGVDEVFALTVGPNIGGSW